MVDQQKPSFDSTSDERVTNNVMRHNYRPLNETEKRHMKEVKDMGLAFVQKLHEIGGTNADFEDNRQAGRYLSLAQTAVEEAVMWAVKEITK